MLCLLGCFVGLLPVSLLFCFDVPTSGFVFVLVSVGGEFVVDYLFGCWVCYLLILVLGGVVVLLLVDCLAICFKLL